MIENLPDTIQNVKVYQPPPPVRPRVKKQVNYAEQECEENDDNAFDDLFDPNDYSDTISDEDDPGLKQNDELDLNNNLHEQLNHSCSKLRGLSVAEGDAELLQSPLILENPFSRGKIIQIRFYLLNLLFIL